MRLWPMFAAAAMAAFVALAPLAVQAQGFNPAQGNSVTISPPPAGGGQIIVTPPQGGFAMPNVPNLTPQQSLPPVASRIAFPTKMQGAPLCGGFVNGRPQPPCNDQPAYVPATYESAAVGTCPSGSFFDIGKWQCWSCPAGYSRSTAAVDTAMACVRPNQNVRGEFLAAKLVGPVCPAGAFFDPIRGGECYTCPAGYNRSIASVDAPDACVRPGSEDFKYAQRAKRTAWPHECSAGTFHDGWDGGGCWSCPAGFNRTGYPIYSDRACVQPVQPAIARATVQKRAFCEPGTIRDGRLDLPLNAPERMGGGQCWTCPDGTERSVYPIAGGQACERGGGREFARATKVQDLTCPAGQHFDFIGVNQGELAELSRTKRASSAARPTTSGSCWSCPDNYVRTVHTVKGGQACELRKIGWRTPPYPEPGMFGFAGSEQVAIDILRTRRALLDEGIIEFAKASGTPSEATRRDMWTEIRNTPQISPILKMAVLDRLRAAIEQPQQATPAELALLQHFTDYIQARRTYIAEDALALYDAWYATDQYYRRQNASNATLATLFDYGTVPPDFYDVAHAGALSGLVTGPALSFGGLYGIAKGIPAVSKKIFPFAARAAKRAVEKAAIKAGEEVAEQVVKQSATIATKASSAIAKVLVYAGPQIILAVAMEVIQAATEQVIEIRDARPKLMARLAEAKQPVDLRRMLMTDGGEEEFNSFWIMATAGERPASPAGRNAMAAALN